LENNGVLLVFCNPCATVLYLLEFWTLNESVYK
jgi:hypothetical protein